MTVEWIFMERGTNYREAPLGREAIAVLDHAFEASPNATAIGLVSGQPRMLGVIIVNADIPPGLEHALQSTTVMLGTLVRVMRADLAEGEDPAQLFGQIYLPGTA